jgi:hypothetical protein
MAFASTKCSTLPQLDLRATPSLELQDRQHRGRCKQNPPWYLLLNCCLIVASCCFCCSLSSRCSIWNPAATLYASSILMDEGMSPSIRPSIISYDVSIEKVPMQTLDVSGRNEVADRLLCPKVRTHVHERLDKSIHDRLGSEPMIEGNWGPRNWNC